MEAENVSTLKHYGNSIGFVGISGIVEIGNEHIIKTAIIVKYWCIMDTIYRKTYATLQKICILPYLKHPYAHDLTTS